MTRQISQLISITGCLEAEESSPPLLLQLLLLSGMEPPLTPPTPEWVAEYPELIWDPDPLIPLTDPEEAGAPTADPAPSGWRSLLKITRYRHQLNSNSATFFNQVSFLKSAFPQITTLQSWMNTKLSPHRYWPCHENGLIKTIQTIPLNLYVSFKLTSLH